MVRAGELIAERFALEQEVAAGGMGRVFRARDIRAGEVVAVKLLTDQRSKARERFMYECAVLAEIRHPGVVRYIAHGSRDQGGDYLVMEWLEGMDLGQYLRGDGAKRLGSQSGIAVSADIEAVAVDLWDDTQDTVTLAPVATLPNSTISNTRIRPSVMSEPLPVPVTIRFARRLASAVAELHRRQFIHCDIKPANLFLPGGDIEQVKLIDFGTVKQFGGAERAGDPGRLSGTPYYMAPEQARATGEHSPATDVWAIGCVLYQCLVGMRPFLGDDLLTVLTRIVMEDPSPLHELRPDVPAPLAGLITAALTKDPSQRPPDADALADRLAQLMGPTDEEGAADALTRGSNLVTGPDTEPTPGPTPGPTTKPSIGAGPGSEPRPVLTSAERRVTCLLFVDTSHVAEDDIVAFQDLVAAHDSQSQRLADGTRIVTIAQARSPTEQASRAARLALKLRALYPAVVQVLVTGRISGRGQGTPGLGPVLDSAVRALRETSPGVIHIDSLTASLLDTRFYLRRTASGTRLRNERPHEMVRTLLGKPIRLVGRTRELQAMTEALRDAVESGTSRALLLRGAAGIGKSRLYREFVRGIDDQPMTCLSARGDATSAGSAFSLLTPALRRLAVILDGERDATRRKKLRALAVRGARPEDRDQLTSYLGELARVPMPEDTCESLVAARRDPLFMGQLMAQNWVKWLDNQCAEQPVVIAIDDLHWADLPSLQYLERALLSLRQRPLVLVAFARPEIRTVYPRLWANLEVREVAIEPLSADASRSLCRQALGRRASPEDIQRAVTLAAGNALYLEEMIRAIAQGKPRHASETLLGMIQERMDGLGPEAKRVLRAASVFGKRFWHGGVECLTGSAGVFNTSEWLDDLVLSETVQRRPVSRLPGDIEYEFHSDLMREGAYAMLTEEDQRLGHRLAGAWLARSGETDPLVLADHFTRGGEPAQAAPYFLRAALMALEGDDLHAVIVHTEQAEDSGASDDLLGRVRALQTVAHYWLSDYAASERYGREALELLHPGTVEWLEALGDAMVSCYRLGARERGDELFERAGASEYADDARPTYISTLCRGAMQFILDGRGPRAEPVIERISSMIVSDDSGSHRAAGQLYNTLGLQAIYRGDWQRVVEHLQDSVTAFEAVGDSANAIAERGGVAYALAELGCYQRSVALARQALAQAERIGARTSRALNRVNLGYFLTHIDGASDEARTLLTTSVDEYRSAKNPRMHGFALARMAILELRCERPRKAEAVARQAVETLDGTSGYLPWALAVHAQTLLAVDQPEPALARARVAVATLERMGAATHGEHLPRLILARALHASEHREQARQTIAEARTQLMDRARFLTVPEYHRGFLSKDDSRQILQLANQWLKN